MALNNFKCNRLMPLRCVIVFRNVIRYDVVTCERKLFQKLFVSLRRRPTEIILFQRVETCLQLLFRNYFTGLLLLVNIFRHVRCR